MYGLVVCGDLRTLMLNQLWTHLINFYVDQELIFTGEVENLLRMDLVSSNAPKYAIPVNKKYQEHHEE